MRFATFAVSALAASPSVALLQGRQDPHKCDLRTFGQPGCSQDNQGVYTLLLSDSGMCKQFVDPVESLTVIDITTDCICELC